MTPQEFLQRVWPVTGPYCLATPFTPPGTTHTTYSHKSFTDIAAAAQFAEAHKMRQDIFFACHGLKEARVWNPQKIDRKTGELGAWEYRTQRNMRASRVFYLDIDVGTSTDTTPKYSDQNEAFHALVNFTTSAGLPKPLVVSSGGGLHIYWSLTDEIASADWLKYALWLHQLVTHFGLKADRSRTTDISSVLRVVGTINHKKGLSRPVEVLHPGDGVLKTQDFLNKLELALSAQGIEKAVTVRRAGGGPDSNLGGMYSGPVPDLDDLLDSCNLMRYIHEHGGDWPYEVWHKSLAVFRCLENGNEVAHEWSERNYPAYSYDEVERKLADQEAQGVGPTSCAVMCSVAHGMLLCGGCKLDGSVNGPVSAALRPKQDPAPRLNIPILNHTIDDIILLPPPEHYIRSNGKVFLEKEKDGKVEHQLVLDYDLYPKSHQADRNVGIDEHVWAAKGPREEAEIRVPSFVIQDQRELAKLLSKASIYLDPDGIRATQKYMSAYLRQLQKYVDADRQYGHFGWYDDYKTFILGDRKISADGTIRTVQCSHNAETVRDDLGFGKAGTLEEQVRLMGLFADSGMVPQQFYICAGLGAILFHMTGFDGGMLSAHGNSGAGKSTMQWVISSFFGIPKKGPLNGSRAHGATQLSRSEMIRILRHLPVVIDEVTMEEDTEMKDFALNSSQIKGRVRVERNGSIKVTSDAKETILKSTLVLTSTNRSVHAMLAEDNSTSNAASMRVLEIDFPEIPSSVKSRGDDMLYNLSKNYGHIGEAFIAYVIQHYDEVHEYVRAMLKKLDAEVKCKGSERIWTAQGTATLVACDLTQRLGLLPFSKRLMKQWFVNDLIPKMRGVVKDDYMTPLQFIISFLKEIDTETVVISPNGASMFPTYMPRNEVSARLERGNPTILYVTMDRLRRYAAKRGVPYKAFLQAVKDMRIITQTNVRKSLSGGTEMASTRPYCFVVDMTHPDTREEESKLISSVARHLKIVT
jgi:hypothetical protein